MCTKTKTTWGCGCSAKDRDPIPCDDAKRYGSFCPDIERYVMERDGDCRECRESPDPYGPGMRGEGRYAQEIRKEQMREKMRGGSSSRPTERGESSRSGKSGTNGVRKSSSSATDDDEPEEFHYEYQWDSPSTTGRSKRSKIKDEDVDIVCDVTPPETAFREQRYKQRRSTMPSHDYSGLGKSDYERSRDEYYQSKGPRISKRFTTHRTSFGDRGSGTQYDFVQRMRDHHRPSRKGRDPGPDGYEYRRTYIGGDIDDFDSDGGFDHDDIAFEDDMGPSLLSERMKSHFPKSRSHRDRFMDSFFPSRDLDDFFDKGFRY